MLGIAGQWVVPSAPKQVEEEPPIPLPFPRAAASPRAPVLPSPWDPIPAATPPRPLRDSLPVPAHSSGTCPAPTPPALAWISDQCLPAPSMHPTSASTARVPGGLELRVAVVLEELGGNKGGIGSSRCFSQDDQPTAAFVNWARHVALPEPQFPRPYNGTVSLGPECLGVSGCLAARAPHLHVQRPWHGHLLIVEA